MLNEPDMREIGPLGFGGKDSAYYGFRIQTFLTTWRE